MRTLLGRMAARACCVLVCGVMAVMASAARAGTSVCCDNATGACTTSIPCPPGWTLEGTGGSCSPNPCPGLLTACCVGATCSIADAAACSGLGGVFQGPNTLCFPNACAVGACCGLTNAACAAKTSVNCAQSGGAYQGNGALCLPNPCFAVSGACCISGGFGACQLSLGTAGCPGLFQGVGTTCSPNNPCAGACCASDGTCVIIGDQGCSTAIPGGVYHGDGSTCVPSPCRPNACCDSTSGVCSVVAASTACPAGSVLASPATGACAPDPCPKGACCDALGGCVISSPTGCTAFYRGTGSTCAAGTCVGACCFSTGVCVPTTMIGCIVGFQGFGSSCVPNNPCPQPLACCNTTTGACTVVAPGFACDVDSTTAPGNASTCTPDPCPQPTACCNVITGVCSVSLPGVACPALTIAATPAASTCAPYPCGAVLASPAATALLCTDCTYVNGPYDGVRGSGQASHLGGALPNGAKAADDFHLAEDFVHDLKTFTATLLTTTTPGLVKPKAEIWTDCNGCPGELLYTFDNALVVDTGLDAGPAFDGRPLRVVHATFDVANQTVVANRNVVLHGGTYWLSVYGRTDGLGPTMQMYDVTYWGTTRGFGGGVQGKPAYKIDGVPNPNYNVFTFPAGCGPTAWHSVADDCCIGCTDLNFTFCTTPCKVLVDNGSGRRQLAGEPVGSTSQFAAGTFSAAETRSADDFVLPGCQDYHICYVEACILTNCPTFDGVFEMYANDCDKPAYALHGQPLGNQQYTATKIIPLGYTAFMDGRTVLAYKLEFHDLPLVLTGGRQYWLSAGVKYTFSINERAYFCYNADCTRPCLVRWNEGRALTATTLDDYQRQHGCQSPVVCNGWAKAANDFSFLIAGDGLTTPGPINSTPSCAADINRDGALNVQDIFDYLGTWFTGCP